MQKKNGLLKITTEKPSKYSLMCQNIADLVKCCICKKKTISRRRDTGKWLRLAQSGISDEDYWTLDNRAEYIMQLATVHKGPRLQSCKILFHHWRSIHAMFKRSELNVVFEFLAKIRVRKLIWSFIYVMTPICMIF